MSMKIIQQYTPQCCERMPAQSYGQDYEAVQALLNHIIKCHPELYAKLKIEGRKEARSQNGCGYWDEGKPSGDGWHKAQPTFRRAWIENALRRRIGLPQ
jgi:hypothetical protein